MAGQFGKRGRFFSRRGLTLPLCTNAFLQRGGPIFSPNPAGNGKHKSSHRRKKVGAVFYIPDFMEIQTPRAFPNRLERWRDNLESAEDFSPARADSPVMHRRIFAEGWHHHFPQSRREWETQKFPPRKKVGAVFYIPDYMKTQAPWTFPNCSERWWDNSEGAEDFSPGKGRLSRYAPAYFQRGAALFFSPIPNGMGKQNSHFFCKRWE